MASIRRYRTAKGERRYSVRWRDADGAEHERAAGPRLEDAQRLRVDIERRQALGALYTARGASFGAALDDYLARLEPTVRASTLHTQRGVARQAAPLRGLRVEDVTFDVVERVVADKAADAPAQARSLLGLIRRVLDDCERRGLVVDQRVRHVRAPKQPPTRRRYLDWHEVEALVGAADHPDDATAILLAASTGLRWQEVFALTAALASGGRVRVAQTLDRRGRLVRDVKASASRRVVPIPEVARDRVAWAARRNGEGPLFPSRRGAWWTPGSWDGVWDGIRERAGVSCRFHDLRHTYAAFLVAGGVHPKTMQRLLGHATISMTLDVYGHLMPEAFDEAVAAFDSAIRDRVRGQSGDGAARV